MSDDNEPENSTSATGDVEDPTIGMNEMQKRLFNVRMRMNQGRKANQAEVQNEFKRFNDPKFDQRQRFDHAQQKDGKREPKQKQGDDGNDDTTKTNEDKTLHTTVEAAERRQRKVEEKEKNMATCGLQVRKHCPISSLTHHSPILRCVFLCRPLSQIVLINLIPINCPNCHLPHRHHHRRREEETTAIVAVVVVVWIKHHSYRMVKILNMFQRKE